MLLHVNTTAKIASTHFDVVRHREVVQNPTCPLSTNDPVLTLFQAQGPPCSGQLRADPLMSHKSADGFKALLRSESPGPAGSPRPAP